MTTKEAITVQSLRSVTDVKKAMAMAQLPAINDDALRTLGNLMGNDFRAALVAVINGDDPDDSKKVLLRRSLSLLTDAVADGLRKCEISVPSYAKLINLGMEKGKEIRDQIATALSGDKEKAAAAKKWLQEAFGAFSSPIPNQPLGNGPKSDSAHQESPARANAARDHVPDAGSYSHEEMSEEGSGQRDYRSVHFYGEKFALCFSASTTKDKSKPTVNIDAANAIPGKQRKFDWQGAIHFQFTPKELPGVLSVLMGSRQSVEYKSHGVTHDKGFSIERQDGRFYAKLFAKDMGSRGVAIPPHEAFQLATLILDQIRAPLPGYSVEAVLGMVAATSRFSHQAAAARP